jgi:hypothetical protein
MSLQSRDSLQLAKHTPFNHQSKPANAFHYSEQRDLVPVRLRQAVPEHRPPPRRGSSPAPLLSSPLPDALPGKARSARRRQGCKLAALLGAASLQGVGDMAVLVEGEEGGDASRLGHGSRRRGHGEAVGAASLQARSGPAMGWAGRGCCGRIAAASGAAHGGADGRQHRAAAAWWWCFWGSSDAAGGGEVGGRGGGVAARRSGLREARWSWAVELLPWGSPVWRVGSDRREFSGGILLGGEVVFVCCFPYASLAAASNSHACMKGMN